MQNWCDEPCNAIAPRNCVFQWLRIMTINRSFSSLLRCNRARCALQLELIRTRRHNLFVIYWYNGGCCTLYCIVYTQLQKFPSTLCERVRYRATQSTGHPTCHKFCCTIRDACGLHILRSVLSDDSTSTTRSRLLKVWKQYYVWYMMIIVLLIFVLLHLYYLHIIRVLFRIMLFCIEGIIERDEGKEKKKETSVTR